MPPLVSILIPAFNAEEYIAAAIKSAISQTWRRREIIVIDDGSSDRTLEIARQFTSDELAVFSQANQGAAATRNALLGRCRGDYVQWLDADDLLAPDKIARQLEVLQQSDGEKTLLSSAWGTFVYQPRKAVSNRSALWGDLSPIEWLLRKMGGNDYMQTGTWLTSRELTEAAGPWDVRLLSDDDGEYFCRVLLASNRVRFVPEARVFYWQTGANRLSHIGCSSRKLEAQVLSMQLHIQYIRSLEDSDRVRTACLSYLQTWLIYFYPERPDLVRKLELLAADLGGRLKIPELRWKFAWLKRIVGFRRAKMAQFFVPMVKASVLRRSARLLHLLESRALGSG